MSDFDRNYAAARRSVGADRAVAIDEGLRAYMIRVYNYMAMGVALTGVVSWFTFQAAVVTNANGAIVGLTSFGQAIFSGPAVMVLFLGTLGLVVLDQLAHRPPAAVDGVRAVHALRRPARPDAVVDLPGLYRRRRSRGCSSSRRPRSAR